MVTSNYALRLPASLKKAAEETARRDGTTLNQLIVTAVAKKVSALRTADYFVQRGAQADLASFDRLMARAGGETPRSGDGAPTDYRRPRRVR